MAGLSVKPSAMVIRPQVAMIRVNQTRAPTFARIRLAGASNRK